MAAAAASSSWDISDDQLLNDDSDNNLDSEAAPEAELRGPTDVGALGVGGRFLARVHNIPFEDPPDNAFLETMPAEIKAWAGPILGAMADARGALGKQKRPLTIGSVCSGTLPEMECCAALGLDYKILAASDPKDIAFKFAQANRDMDKIDHFMTTFESIIWREGFCKIHNRECKMDAAGDSPAGGAPSCREDVCCAGLPCQPVSTQRDKRFADGSVANHSKFKLYEDYVEYLKERAPRSVIFEQVLGFGKPTAAGEASQLEIFHERVKELGFYGIRVLKSCGKVFLDVSRVRCHA